MCLDRCHVYHWDIHRISKQSAVTALMTDLLAEIGRPRRMLRLDVPVSAGASHVLGSLSSKLRCGNNYFGLLINQAMIWLFQVHRKCEVPISVPDTYYRQTGTTQPHGDNS